MRRPSRLLAPFLPLLLAGVASAQAKPVDLQAVRDTQNGTWAVPATVGGRTGLFLVLFNHRESLVSRAWLAGAKPKIVLGGQSLGEGVPGDAAQLTLKVAGQPIVGTLGSDALAHLALGFDYAKSTVRLWTGLKPQDAAAFLDGDTVSVPLVRLASGVPAVEATRAGRGLVLQLLPFGSVPVLPQGDRRPEDLSVHPSYAFDLQGRLQSPAGLLLTDDLAVGGYRPSWTYYTAIPALGSDAAGGGFPLVPSGQPRTVVDFAGRALYLRRYTRDEEIAIEVSHLTNAAMHLEGDTFVIGTLGATDPAERSDYWSGQQLVDIGPYGADIVLNALRGKDRLAFLGRLNALETAPLVVAAQDKNTNHLAHTFTVAARYPVPVAEGAKEAAKPAPEPTGGIDLPALVDPDRVAYTVPVTVGDKVGRFLVAFEHKGSAVSDEWLGDAEPTLSVGGRPAGTAERWPAAQFALRVEGEPIVGILGNGALADCAVGFDFAAKRVTLWPKPDAAVLSRYLGGAVARVPLAFRPSGTPTVEATLEGRKATLVLTTHDDQLRVRPDLRRPTDLPAGATQPVTIGEGNRGPTALLLKPDLAFGPFHLPWAFCEPSFTDEAPELAGTLPLHTTGQIRVVVDLPGRALLLRPRTEEEGIAFDLARLTSIPLRADGGRLLFGEMADTGAQAALKPYEGKEIRTLAGVDVRDFLTRMRGVERLRAFAAIRDATAVGYDVAFVDDPASTELGHLKVNAKPASAQAQSATPLVRRDPSRPRSLSFRGSGVTRHAPEDPLSGVAA